MKKWLLISGMLLAVAPATLHAQGCAMCTKTASDLDKHSARGLNGGIMYLAFLPLAIIGTVGVVWWRGSRPRV